MDSQPDPSDDLEPLAPDWNEPGLVPAGAPLPPPTPPTPPAPPTPPVRTRRRRNRLVASLTLATMAAGGVGGYSITRSLQSSTTKANTTSSASASAPPTTSTGTRSRLSTAQIEAAVDPALVDITSTLGTTGTAAGTGMVISSTGEILTNNHVIAGATSISVRIGGSGTAYTATVVGYDATDDVAVLQIPNVSGLTTVTTASASSVSANDTVVAIGNALGKGGTPVAAVGVVTAVNQTITASDDSGSARETLQGLIELSAAVEPGDSGGATVNAYGQVIGMTTAASSGGFRPLSTSAEATTAYAIPIDSALTIARRIEAGTETANVHIGLHGLLGVQVQSANTLGTNDGALVVGLQSDSAAAVAGISSGDTIISINRRSISSVSDLNDTMAATHVGDKITVGWQDSAGGSHQATVTLTTGAA